MIVKTIVKPMYRFTARLFMLSVCPHSGPAPHSRSDNLVPSKCENANDILVPEMLRLFNLMAFVSSTKKILTKTQNRDGKTLIFDTLILK